MKKHTAAGIGEILWDMFPDGKQLGGAPSNFSYHFSALGGTGIPVSCVGDDQLGREALDLLQARGLNIRHICLDPMRPTGRVDIVVNKDGSPKYLFPDDVAWDNLTISQETMELATNLDVACFGTLGQRGNHSRQSIRNFIKHASSSLKILDINLRQEFYSPSLVHDSLQLADVLKINDEELDVVTEIFNLEGEHRTVLHELIIRYRLELVVLTRGEKGSMIMSHNNESDLPGTTVQVKDTVGAGDAFTAAMALGYLAGHDLDQINAQASKVAAFVCTQCGAMPVIPEELRITV